MSPETNFAVAFAVTLLLSCGACLVIWRYLDPVFADYCGNADRGRFWTIFTSAIIILVPMIALSLNLPPEHTWRTWVFPFVAIVRWPVFAMLIAAVIVGVISLALHVPRDLPISRNDMDDLRRLLDKVQEMRARELISRLDATKPVNPKDLDELHRLVDKIQAVRTRDLHSRGDAASTN